MTENRAIIFDSGTLISLSMSCLIGELKKLKSIFKGHFIITSDVKREVIDKPLTIKRFELEALRLTQLVNEKILESPTVFGINEDELSKKTQEIKNLANVTFQGRDRDIHIIDSGEASCLALSNMLTEKGIKNVIAVDERTTRILGEKPENVKKLFEKKLNTQITAKTQNYNFFKGHNFIRSSELVYVAYKKGLTGIKDPRLLDALLYAVKFKGCAISGDEIKEIKKIG